MRTARAWSAKRTRREDAQKEKRGFYEDRLRRCASASKKPALRWLNSRVPDSPSPAKTFMDSEQLAELAADACDDRKAVDIQLIRVDEVSSLADWMVIAGGQDVCR